MKAYVDQRVSEQAKSIPQHYDCSCCGSKNTIVADATMAAFVMERMLDRVQLDKWLTQAIQCRDCGYIATAFRFTDEQMQRYYEDYMLIQPSAGGRQHGSYVFHRRRTEGNDWFKLALAYENSTYKEVRKDSVMRCIARYTDVNAITSVLDYGGDLGQYIPDEFKNIRRHVVEIEERNFVDGVVPVASPEDCEPVDLVTCCHTLEHVSWPNDLVQDMLRYLKPGGLLYLEVPNETAMVENHADTKQMLHFHEHINIFYVNSLTALMQRNNVRPLQTFDLRYDSVYKDFSPAYAIVGVKQ